MQKKEKDIVLEEIMDLLNTHNSAHDSLRLSEDYNLSIRGTFRDQYEEIDFKFLEEQENLEQLQRYNREQVPAQSNVELKVETFGRNRQVIINPKKEDLGPSHRKLKTRNSIKLSEQMQKRVSSRDNPDQFTKKYDSLFDEIFFKERLKEADTGQNSQPREQQIIQHQKLVCNQQDFSKTLPVSAPNTGNNSIEVPPLINPTQSVLIESVVASQKKAQMSQNKSQKHTISSRKSLGQSGNCLNIQPLQPKPSESQLPFGAISSSHSISSLPQLNNPCDFLSKQILEVLIQNYGQNQRLVESLKPQVRINFHDKKPLITFRTVQVQPPPTIRINQAIRINPNPTIRINSANQNPVISHPTIRISPNQCFTQIKNNPQINFNYRGPSATYVKQNEKSEIYNDLKQKQKDRLPIFLRRLRELTSSYPNLYSKQALTQQNCSNLKNELASAFQEVKQGIKKLKAVHLKYHETMQAIKRLYKEMTNNINSSKKNDLKTLQFFKSNNWHVEEALLQLQQIKPHQVFQKRQLDQLEFMTLLNTFEQLISSMEKEPSLNLDNLQTFKTYMSCRQKLWNIQKNLRLMSEDFYLKAILKINLPPHIIESHQILTYRKKLSEDERNRQIQRLAFLQDHKDIFATCCLGQQTLKVLINK